MAYKYIATSAAFAATSQRSRVTRLTISGSDPGATDPGTVVLKTGGTGGSAVLTLKVLFGHTEQIELPRMVADWCDVTDAVALVEFQSF